MTTRRQFMAGCVCVVLALGLSGTPRTVRADTFGDGAEKFVNSMAILALETLTVKNISSEERAQRFRAILRDHFAVKTIGRWVLGRYWRKATKAERREYLALFEDLVVNTYAARFKLYSGETLSTTGTLVEGDADAVVQSVMTRPRGGAPIEIGWRVRARAGKYKVVDIIVEGISMGQTQRSEFASVIRKSGGTIAGLLTALRK